MDNPNPYSNTMNNLSPSSFPSPSPATLSPHPPLPRVPAALPLTHATATVVNPSSRIASVVDPSTPEDVNPSSRIATGVDPSTPEDRNISTCYMLV